MNFDMTIMAASDGSLHIDGVVGFSETWVAAGDNVQDEILIDSAAIENAACTIEIDVMASRNSNFLDLIRDDATQVAEAITFCKE